MKITKVFYQKTYPTGQYANEKIGLEADIEEGEDIQFVVCNLKHECDQIHQKNNPHLYQEQDKITLDEIARTIPHTQYKQPPYDGSLNNANVSQPIENQLTQEQKIHNLISQSTSIPELKQYHLLSQNKKYPELKEIY